MTASGEAPRPRPRILVCEDEAGLRDMLAVHLGRSGFDVTFATDAAEASALLRGGTAFDLVLTDLVMPRGSGMDVLDAAREQGPSIQVVLMTAYATTAQAVEAMRRGAYDYVQKPFKLDELRATLEKALEKSSLIRENVALRERVRREISEFGIVGRSAAIQRVRGLVRRMAPAAANVLVTGESGTGKEVVARALHTESPRASQPFVSLNCGAVPEHLVESELFGHEKGAFTGASGAGLGLVRASDGGTLFLDEIGELPLQTQVKLLRVLQERVVRPVGSTKEHAVDLRVIAATNRFLEEDVKRGAFRSDLYYRLNVLRIHLPPLRERPEDIEPLVRHFLEQNAILTGRRLDAGPELMAALARFSFPGNVRELENLVQRGAALAAGSALALDDVLDGTAEPTRAPDVPRPEELGEGFDLDAHLGSIERAYLFGALQQTGGKRTEAAKLLGMSFRSFRYRIAKYEGGELPDDERS